MRRSGRVRCMLTKNVDHIKSVVRMQQEHARFVGVVEQVTLPELLDDALRLHSTSFEQLGIQVRREYLAVPAADGGSAQLLRDPRQPAEQRATRAARQPRARTSGSRCASRPRPRGGLRIEVSDNGTGISPEHLSRIFSQGFTTKKSGHGFGLHASALAAS